MGNEAPRGHGWWCSGHFSSALPRLRYIHTYLDTHVDKHVHIHTDVCTHVISLYKNPWQLDVEALAVLAVGTRPPTTWTATTRWGRQGPCKIARRDARLRHCVRVLSSALADVKFGYGQSVLRRAFLASVALATASRLARCCYEDGVCKFWCGPNLAKRHCGFRSTCLVEIRNGRRLRALRLKHRRS